MKITWSRRAHRELDAVLAFIAQDNPQAAEEIVEKIMHAVRMLKTSRLITSSLYIDDK